MSAIWLLQRPNVNEELASFLTGNFPVRRIATLSSLKLLVRMHPDSLPEALVVGDEASTPDFMEYHRNHLRGIPALVLTSAPVAHQNLIRIRPDVTERELGLLLTELLAHRRLRSYKDLLLDPERRAFRVEPSTNWESLSQRELSLLGYLLDHPAKFISKDQIRRQVWSGTAVSPRTIASQVSRLRRRLEGSEVSIESSYRQGYRIV